MYKKRKVTSCYFCYGSRIVYQKFLVMHVIIKKVRTTEKKKLYVCAIFFVAGTPRNFFCTVKASHLLPRNKATFAIWKIKQVFFFECHASHSCETRIKNQTKIFVLSASVSVPQKSQIAYIPFQPWFLGVMWVEWLHIPCLLAFSGVTNTGTRWPTSGPWKIVL